MFQRPRPILLVVSLALNLFLIGTVVGGLVVGQRLRAMRPPPERGGPALWAAARGLSPAHRDAYREVLRGEGGEVRSKLRAAREARMQAWKTLGQEPFDAGAVRQRLAAARTQDTAARQELEDRLVAFAASLPADERVKLAEGLSQPGPHRPPRDRR
jgi:uncharacterized membrane protein